MNEFKQKRAVAECKAMRERKTCPHVCMHWQRKGQLFCGDAFAAERRAK